MTQTLSKATSAPWKLVGRYVVALKHKIVCEVPQGGVRSGKVDVANGHLIAAAPELLEWARLLERCLVYEIKKSQIFGDDEGATLKRPHLRMVRETIAKAEGNADRKQESL